MEPKRSLRLTRYDIIALLLSLAAIFATYFVTVRVFEAMPHIEDEMAYVWQAQAIAGGHLTLPTPVDSKSFLVPFVVDYNGRRFGKYPLGWPVLLALGVFLKGRALVNPLLAGLGVWLTYRLGQRAFSPIIGLLAAALTLTSPFFLMNSGSLLSHPFGLCMSAAFALTWLDAWDPVTQAREAAWRRWLPVVTSALSLGVLLLTRPLTAVGVAFPFALHGVYLLVRGSRQVRVKLFAFVAIVLAMASLLFLWQYAVTGDPLLNPYTLWWPYDKIGFGPGVGRIAGGHSLHQAQINTEFSLWVGWSDLFGWPEISWLFLPFGILALLRRRDLSGWLLFSVFPALVVVYLAYWIGSSLFGPRYFYESLYSLTISSAAGIAYLAGWPLKPGDPWSAGQRRQKLRPLGITAVVALLVGINLAFYTPMRVGGMYNLYGISRARLAPFETQAAQELTPALVIVHPKKWIEYGALLELQDVYLDTPFIFVVSQGSRADAKLVSDYPGRKVIYYYPDEPYHFYSVPREK